MGKLCQRPKTQNRYQFMYNEIGLYIYFYCAYAVCVAPDSILSLVCYESVASHNGSHLSESPVNKTQTEIKKKKKQKKLQQKNKKLNTKKARQCSVLYLLFFSVCCGCLWDYVTVTVQHTAKSRERKISNLNFKLS